MDDRILPAIEEVARLAGIDLSPFHEDAAGRLRGPCPFQKHRSEKLGPFVLYPSSDGSPGGWKCFAGCGEGGVKELAERLGLSPYRNDDVKPGSLPEQSGSARRHQDSRPRLTPEQAERVAQLSLEHLRSLLRLREEGGRPDEEVFAFCNARQLPGILEPDSWADGEPIAGILPDELPEDLRPILGGSCHAGYRLVLPLFDKATGKTIGLQLRNVRPDAEPKTLSYGHQGDGALFANHAGRALLTGEAGAPAPPRIVVAEGFTDFSALCLSTRDPAFGLAGAASAARVFVGPDGEAPVRWLRDADLVIATDSDEAGERAARVIADVAHRRGGARTVRRVPWPGKDACALLESEGPEALAEAVERAPLLDHPRYRFRIIPGLSRFLQEEHPRPASLVGDGLVRERDFALLSGKAYSGKSWLTLELALNAAAGVPWLGFPTRKCRVGLFSREIGAGDLQARIAVLLGRQAVARAEDLAIFPAVHPYVRGHVDLVEDLAGLKDFCWGNRLDLLILDPLSRLHTTDENSSHEFKPVMMAVDEIREECETAVLVVHHDRKSGAAGSDGDLDAPRGSSLLTTNPTVSMRLVELEKFRRLSFHLNHAKPPDPVYLVPVEDGGFGPVEAPLFGKQLGDSNESKVRELLQARGNLTYEEGQELAGVGEGTLRRIFQKLEAEHYVIGRREGRRVRYHLNTPATPQKGVEEQGN